MPSSQSSNSPEGVLGLTTSPFETAPSSAELGTLKVQLLIVHSPDPAALGRRILLSRRDKLAFGRGAEQPQALLVDPRLSRSHAELSFDERAGQFRVTDCHSRNGTFVNGRAVESALLEPGAVIRLGNSLLVFDDSDPMSQLRERVAEVAGSARSLLILGETGSGKEVLARQIHEQSGRSGDFVAINCAALPSEMIAAELFGHTRGAFSGASRERPGLLRAAQGGTLLLDEIGDMPLDLQPTLLRVLQDKQVRPLGADHEVPIDVRVLAATHHDLDAKLASREFRADLYARLAQGTLRIPPLRARRAELLALARSLAEGHGLQLELSTESAEALLLWPWPLNFRELDSLLAQLSSPSGQTRAVDLALLRKLKPELAELDEDDAVTGTEGVRETVPPASQLPRSIDESELRAALHQAEGNVVEAARILGVSRQKLYRLLDRAGLKADAFRVSPGSVPRE